MVEFRSLGSLAVLERGETVPVGGPRQRRLLAMLLIHRNSVVSVDRLAEAVFAGEPTDAAGTTLRSYVARMRKSLGTTDADVSIVTQAPGYLLRAPDSSTDAGRFEAGLIEGQHHLVHGDPAQAAAVLREALALWHGDAYAEFADEDWARPEAQRLAELRTVAEERLVDAELACGNDGDVIARLDALIDEHPLRESFRAQLMTALFRSGRQADALRAFRRYREQLADEVGLDPSPALFDLERRILDHDPTLDLAEPAGEPLLGYRLGPRLGTSQNGTIHAARLAGVDDEFVVHILRGEQVDTPDFVGSFEANAREIAGLHHPAILPIHDFWREPGAAYVVSRRVHMRTLRDRLEQGPLSLAELATIVRRVGGALAHAADRGILHGAVSIDTLLVDESGRSFVSDFGVVHETPPDDVAGFAAAVGECLDRVDTTLERTSIDLTATGSCRTDMRAFTDRVLARLDPDRNAPDASRPNPFKGLRPFDETDEHEFFGRDDLVAELLRRLASDDPGHRLTLVVGGSGSGKSSAVRAGLVPRVRRGEVGDGNETWFATMMLPGSSPFKELVESLRRVAIAELASAEQDLREARTTLGDLLDVALPDEGRLVLIVDQFEEIFTLTPEDQQAAFLDCLADAVSDQRGRLRVVATLRADFYDRPLAFQRFGALVDDATVAVAALSPAALESAIVGPVTAIGAEAEPPLVAELVAAVTDQPAALPSLQFTLFELAELRSDRRLTLDGYRALGGVEGAIASRAEALYLAMDDDGRAAIRDVFEQLVVIGTDGEVTGRRSTRSTLGIGRPDRVGDGVIDRWTEARLLTTDHDPHSRVPTVQFAHEAILRSWPRLEQWIEDDRVAIATIGHLRDAAQSWQELERDDGALYRGARLDQAIEAVDAAGVDLPELEHDFLETSRARRNEEQQAAAEHAERQDRTNRRLRRQLAVIAAALVVALVVGMMAVGQRREAEAQRRNAEAQRSRAFARELAAAAEANVVDDPERSILLALQALTTDDGDTPPPPEAVNALHRAVSASRILLDVPGLGGRLAVSPLGDVFVTEGPEDSGMIDLRDLTDGTSVRSWRGDDVDINDVAFSRDGTMLASTGDDGSASVWDPASGEELLTIDGDGPAWYPSFSADGTRLSLVWTDAELIQVVDVPSGTTVSILPTTTGDSPVQLSPDGTKLALGSWEPPYAVVKDVATGEVITEVDTPGDAPVYNVAWSPSGLRLATGDNAGFVTIVDAQTGNLRGVGVGHSSSIVGLTWSRDGSLLASGSNDGTVRVWDATSDVVTERYRFGARDLTNGVPGVGFTPDGERLVVGDWLITAAKVFDLRAEATGELGGFRVPDGGGTPAFSRDGHLLTTSDDAAITERHVDTGQVTRTFQDGTMSHGFALSQNRRFAAAATKTYADEWGRGQGGFPVRILDLESDEIVGTFAPGAGSLDWIEWSPDGDLLAITYGDDDGSTVVVVDRGGEVLATIDQPGFYVPSVAFDATGEQLAIAKNSRSRFDPERDRLEIYDWRREDVIRTLDVVAVDVTSSSAANTWITSTFNGANVDVWDAATGSHLVELAGHTGIVRGIAVSDDGSRIVTGSDDGTVRLWDAATGVQLQLITPAGEVAGIALDPDGTKVAVIDDSGVVTVWALDVGELASIAATRVTRQLDDLECRQYLHVDRCDQA